MGTNVVNKIGGVDEKSGKSVRNGLKIAYCVSEVGGNC